MAFQAVTFPKMRLTHGMVKTVIDPMIITGNGVRELRRRQTRFDRFLWSFPARNLDQTDVDALYKFYVQVNRGLDSFRFQDPEFPEYNSSPLLHRSGTTWYLGIPDDATTGGRHPVFNPVMGSLSFTRNGSPVTPTFSISSDGFPIVTITGSSGTDDIRVTGPVYMTARFESPLSFTIVATSKSALNDSCTPIPTMQLVGDVNLIEVFEV